MTGYNIQCDPGGLYTRKCYTVYCTDASGASCTCGSAGCTEHREEIIAYTSGGDPISKQTTNLPPGVAWIPSLTTLDQSGQAYRPYGEAGIPWTPFGMANIGQGVWPAGETSSPEGSSSDGSSQPMSVGSQSARSQVTFTRKETLTLAAVGVAATASLFGLTKYMKKRKAMG